MAAFRDLHEPGNPFLLANAWDRGSARVLAALGAEAIGTTSAGHAFTLGLPDGGNVSRESVLQHASDLIDATPLPVSADLENGFGPDPSDVAATVALGAAAGLAGCSIEDTAWPSTTSYDFDEACNRIAAAATMARALPDDFVLVARADGLMHHNYELDEAIERIKAFESMGADCVYIPSLPDLAAVERVCASVRVPVNVLVVGPMTRYRRDQFAEAGVGRLSLGSALARVGHQALVDSARSVLTDGDFTTLAHGASGKTIDELLLSGSRPSA